MSTTGQALNRSVLEECSLPLLGHWLKKLNIEFGSWEINVHSKEESSQFYNVWEMFLEFVKNGDIEEALELWND